MGLKTMTAEEAARLIKDGDNVGFSGFTSAGCAKAVPFALANYAREEHAKGNNFKISIISGASTGYNIDAELTNADAVAMKMPYQGHKEMRESINKGNIRYFDLHLSQVAQQIRAGFFGKINVAILEACEVTEDGKIVPTMGIGISPTVAALADIVIVELNSFYPKELKGIHDLAQLKNPPHRVNIDIERVDDRVGEPYIKVDPSKIVVVNTNLGSEGSAFAPIEPTTAKIGENLANFLVEQMEKGMLPKEFLPIQSGVGNVANAALYAMGDNLGIPNFDMYTEVVQDSVISLMEKGRVKFASTCSLSVSNEVMDKVYANLDFFKERLVMRSTEYTNNAAIVRKLGIITINTALEADIFGNVNSTHVAGSKMMNGIGGSADFTRNAYLSIFLTPSVSKGGKISNIVPMVSHTDHTEHSVHIIATEYGVADLRGKSPRERAEEIIEKCAHPEYRPLLREYLTFGSGHTPMDLDNAFAFHKALLKTGDMRDVKWVK